MVTPALRAVLIRAEGAGALQGADVRTGVAAHPVCGDEVELDLRVEGDRLAALRWRARGCPASTAVCAAAATALPGHPLAGLPVLLRARLQELGGLQAHERHAERLFLDALAAALRGDA